MTALDHAALESRRETLQKDIDVIRSAAERNRSGQFATPNTLAVAIARYAATLLGPSVRDLRFADPSIGSGSFFSAALSVFGSDRLSASVGIELDPVFAEAARELWGKSGLQIVQGDFTRVVANGSCPRAPNLVLANPPYVRHHHLGREEKQRLQALVADRTGLKVNGLAGLYVYFVLLATDWMEPDGLAVWLIPSEFMDVNYGEVLKNFLADHVTLVRLHRFDPAEVQFDDAQVSSAVLVFRKTPPSTDHAVEFTFGGSLDSPQVSERVPSSRLRETRKWTAFPVHARNDRRGSSEHQGPVLGDFFRVQRGVATGCNEFFILERSEARRLHLPDTFLRPILPSPRHLKHTVVESDPDGYPAMDRPLCLIDCNLPEPLVTARHPELWAYLQTAETLGHREGYLVRKRTPWYRQEQRAPTPFLCTYMGRGTDGQPPFRFIWNRSKAIGTNLYLMLAPTGRLGEMLLEHPERAAVVHDWLGRITGHELRGEGRVYGGGLNKIEPAELARIPAGRLAALWPDLLFAWKLSQQRELFGEKETCPSAV
jgi:adenine-specific DNA-methyltransferase